MSFFKALSARIYASHAKAEADYLESVERANIACNAIQPHNLQAKLDAQTMEIHAERQRSAARLKDAIAHNHASADRAKLMKTNLDVELAKQQERLAKIKERRALRNESVEEFEKRIRAEHEKKMLQKDLELAERLHTYRADSQERRQKMLSETPHDSTETMQSH